jgi:hypothetical protein
VDRTLAPHVKASLLSVRDWRGYRNPWMPEGGACRASAPPDRNAARGAQWCRSLAACRSSLMHCQGTAKEQPGPPSSGPMRPSLLPSWCLLLHLQLPAQSVNPPGAPAPLLQTTRLSTATSICCATRSGTQGIRGSTRRASGAPSTHRTCSAESTKMARRPSSGSSTGRAGRKGAQGWWGSVLLIRR